MSDIRIPTTTRLANVLMQVNAPSEMIQNAKNGVYDDYKGETMFPQMTLMSDAVQAGLPEDFLFKIQNGEFECALWEGEDWLASEEGQQVIRDFGGEE